MTTLLHHKFGPYGGQFVPETLMPALIELEEAFVSAKADVEFQKEFNKLMASFVGRPTPLTYAKPAHNVSTPAPQKPSHPTP